MNAWLYQMRNNRDWTPADYRAEVSEGKPVTWSHDSLRIYPRGRHLAKGDVLFFYFVPTGCSEPGLYGWGKVVKWDPKQKELTFHALPPSDARKKQPSWNYRIKQLIDAIRLTQNVGTMWRIVSDRQAAALLQELNRGLVPER